MKLIFATHNPGKVDEIKKIFHDLPVEILSLDDVGIGEEVEENGKTAEENALIKARFTMEKTSEWTMADDTGLYIDALDGQPGIHASRWAGDDFTSNDLAKYTLKRMKAVPAEERTARFKTSAVLMSPKNKQWTFEGVIEGSMMTEERGTSHPRLPYDRIFLPDGYDQTFAQMTKDQKNAISHRAQAFRKLKKFLVCHSS